MKANSEAGQGEFMVIEIGDNGLRTKYWWTPYDIPGTEDPIQAAYLAIRQRCPFLTETIIMIGKLRIMDLAKKSIRD